MCVDTLHVLQVVSACIVTLRDTLKSPEHDVQHEERERVKESIIMNAYCSMLCAKVVELTTRDLARGSNTNFKKSTYLLIFHFTFKKRQDTMVRYYFDCKGEKNILSPNGSAYLCKAVGVFPFPLSKTCDITM
jgi:hypothetical protein